MVFVSAERFLRILLFFLCFCKEVRHYLHPIKLAPTQTLNKYVCKMSVNCIFFHQSFYHIIIFSLFQDFVISISTPGGRIQV